MQFVRIYHRIFELSFDYCALPMRVLLVDLLAQLRNKHISFLEFIHDDHSQGPHIVFI